MKRTFSFVYRHPKHRPNARPLPGGGSKQGQISDGEYALDDPGHGGSNDRSFAPSLSGRREAENQKGVGHDVEGEPGCREGDAARWIRSIHAVLCVPSLGQGGYVVEGRCGGEEGAYQRESRDSSGQAGFDGGHTPALFEVDEEVAWLGGRLWAC